MSALRGVLGAFSGEAFIQETWVCFGVVLVFVLFIGHA